MLSQANKPVSEPLYEYLMDEEDLDIDLDDQPIDFSKGYSDVGSKSLSKKRLRSTSASISSEPTGCKQPCEDDIRVYCLEGTPMLISTSSSMCDLRDISPLDNCVHKRFSTLEDSLALAENPDASPETFKNDSMSQKKNEVLSVSEEEKQKYDTQSGDNLQTFRLEEKSSKASSPLMLSRSSSVGSLNSFDQNSIVDDRSSVSFISNLTSGLISPSDLPDSPGEAMSPFIPKNRQVFQFPPIDTNNSVTDPKTGVDEACNDGYDDAPEDVVKVYDEETCSTMSSFSELSIHTSSHASLTHENDGKCNGNMVQKTSVKMEVITESEDCQDSNLEYFVTEKSIEMLQPAPIENDVLSNNLDESSCSTLEETKSYSNESQASVNSTLKFEDMKNTSVEEDIDSDSSLILSDDEAADALLEQCIRSGKGLAKSSFEVAPKVNEVDRRESLETCTSLSFSDDDEADELLKKCIEMGKPPKVKYERKVNVQESKSGSLNLRDAQPRPPTKNTLVANDNIVHKPVLPMHRHYKQVPNEKIKKVAKVHDHSANKGFKQRSGGSQTCNKGKYETSPVKGPVNHLPNCSVQLSRGRNEQNHSFHGMKPKSLQKQDKPLDHVKKLRKELFIKVYKTLHPEKSYRHCVPSRSEYNEHMLPNYCGKYVMSDKNNKKHSSNVTHSPSRTKQISSQSKRFGGYVHEHTSSSSRTNQYFCYSNTGQQVLQHGRTSQAQVQPKSSHYAPVYNHQSQCKKHSQKDYYKHSHQKYIKREEFYNKVEEDPEDDESEILRQCIRQGMPSIPYKPSSQTRDLRKKPSNQDFYKSLEYRDRRPDGMSDEEDNILTACINAGKPKAKPQSKSRKERALLNNLETFLPQDTLHSVFRHSEHIERDTYRKIIQGIPIGNSDYDEDQILNAVINLGMPCTYLESKPSKGNLSRNKTSIANPKRMVLQKQSRSLDSNFNTDPTQQSSSFTSSRKNWTSRIIPDKEAVTKGEEYLSVHKTDDTPLLSRDKTSVANPNRMVLQKQNICFDNNFNTNPIQQSPSFIASRKNLASRIVPDEEAVTKGEESLCVYNTEDTPLLSRTPSMSNLSSLSFNDEKNNLSNLNDSRDSDLSSDLGDDDDYDDELLMRCIQSGMPSAK